MKKILITGATGFVGSHVAKLLKESGHEVIALVRNSSQDNYLRYLGIKLVYGNIEDPLLSKLSQQLPNVDVCIHLAGIIKTKKISDFELINTKGSANVYGLCKKVGVPRFVFVSSIAARGPNRIGVADTELQPVSHYGRSKRVAEEIIKKERNGPSLVIIRPPVVYGPGDRETLTLFRFIKRGFFPIIGSGAKRVSFIYVEDLAKMLAAAATGHKVKEGPYYPEDGSSGYSWLQIHQMAERITKQKIRKIHIPHVVAKTMMSVGEFYAKLKKRAPMLSRDKYAEIKQDAWTCDVQDILSDFELDDPLVPLNIGLEKARNWYIEKGWI